MKLKEQKDPKELIKVLSNVKEIHFEFENGHITRITFGELDKPLAIVSKPESYNSYLSIKTLEYVTRYRSSAVINGSLITHITDTENQLQAWEDQIKSMLNVDIEFNRTEETCVE